MNISEIFVRRPVATALLMAAILIFGVVAYRALPVNDLPNVDYPTITVSAALPGASPETMASSVATPLERAFATIAGVESMSSSNTQGQTAITLQFELSRNIDAAAQDVQAKIASELGDLPPNMPAPPTYEKVNPADSPIMYLAVTSDTLPLSQVDEYAETMLAQRISMISGVAQVEVYGQAKYAVRVLLDPLQMASRGIGIDEVAGALGSGNVNLPSGTLWGPRTAFTVNASGQLDKAAQYRPLVVAYRNGAPVRLEQLGDVLDSIQNDKDAAWYNGSRSVVLAIRRQPGTNTIEVVNNITAVLPQMQALLPASVGIHTLYDDSQYIRASVTDLKFTLLLTICLVVLVIFLFLRNISATVIPSLALPMSLVGTFAVMYLLGYTVDNLSMLALTLSVGFVVDDAIVMLENIVRHLERGSSALQAALIGSREIGFTIVSMTISLVAVFIPFFFLGGILGRLLHEFAITIASAILVSGVVSLTLTPMLCSRFLRAKRAEGHGAAYRATERGFDAMLRGYDRSLRFALRHKFATMVMGTAMLAAAVYMAVAIPKGFLPSEDRGELFGIDEAQQGTSYEAMVRYQEAVDGVIRHDANVESAMSAVGWGATNRGVVFLRLKPLGQRKIGADAVMQELRAKLMGIPGVLVFLQNPPPISVGSQFTKSMYQVTLQSPDTAALDASVGPLVTELQKHPELQDVTTDLQMDNPQLNVKIDRERASALGVTAQQVEEALYSAYGSRLVSTIYAPQNEYFVIIGLKPQYQSSPQALSLLYLRSNSGKLVPLNAVADLQTTLGPLSVNHTGEGPSVTVSFNLRPGVSLGDALADVQQVLRRQLPQTVTSSLQGAAEVFESSQRGLGLLLVMAVLVIYLVLGVLYESFIHPLTILSGLPAAGFGALATLYLFHVDLNLYALVGVILLVGLVKKNAIMMIDFALEAKRKEGKGPEEAIYQGALVRFRPIMMTTMAALLGTVPIAFGTGQGADSRRPLGLAVLGGLVFSQMLTLYLTPVFYVYMDRLQNRLSPAPAGLDRAPEMQDEALPTLR
jgi:HAE1 family hydrophobic/amphiphilic exporter-1